MGSPINAISSTSHYDPPSGKRAALTSTNVMTVLIAGMGGFVFGYCNNSIAGTLVQTSFGVKFLSGPNASSLVAGILGCFLGGGFIGAIVQAPISNRYGRRFATGTAAVLTIISAILQAASYHMPTFMVGRVFCGIGAGIVITNCPVHMSEISPSHVRGLLVSNHAISIVYAYILSSLAALGFYFVDAEYQWRLQYILLAFFALVLLVSLAFLPESPRWLCEVGRDEEALAVLQRLHRSKDGSGASMAAREEMDQIKAQIEIERALPSGYIYIMKTPHLRHRAFCSVLTWIMGQSTGILVIANLTPTLFGQLGYSVVLQLGLSVAWTVCALLGCFVNAGLMDRFGRVKLMVAGGYGCSAVLVCESVLQKFYLGSTNTSGINAAVAFYFIFIFVYGSTVDCAAYVYVSEIWPTHLRSYGNTIGLCAFFCCAIAYTSPATLAFQQIGWKYYWVMISTCIVTSTLMIFVCPETSKLTLEEISARFGDPVVSDFSGEMQSSAAGTTASANTQKEQREFISNTALA